MVCGCIVASATRVSQVLGARTAAVILQRQQQQYRSMTSWLGVTIGLPGPDLAWCTVLVLEAVLDASD
jgi:hypothetical protein